MADSSDGDKAIVTEADIDADIEEKTEAEKKPFERDTSLNVWQRINLAMAEVTRLDKDKEVKKADGKKMYDYISHDLVSAAVRKPLIKHGVAVKPSVAKHSKDGNRTELTLNIAFINIDNPKDRFAVESIGYGVDPSDKGPGKAMSYAIKYALLKLFMLNSADDIEDDDIEHISERGEDKRVLEEKLRNRDSIEAWANGLRTALESADTPEAINELQKSHKAVLMSPSTPQVTREYFVGLIEKRKKAVNGKEAA
jgi:hypothetical protein